METLKLDNDVKVFCTTAKSFPDGIQEAFITLDKMLSKEGRSFYGISYFNERGGITYKAAVTENFEGEADNYGFESLTIPKGEYLSVTIKDWMQQISAIGETFKKLLKEPGIDTSCSCIEWYKSDKELTCMMKLKK